MTDTTNFATGTAQGAAVAHTYQVGAIVSTTTSDVTPGFIIFFIFFAKKENLLLSLFCKSHLNNTIWLTNFKQKVSLAVYGRWFRKGHEHFVSEMWFATLKTAFLFNNLVKRY
ncbi:MAG: hypothetical protein E7122_02650 [Bacteroidales bacterium]|nr:hypothetical protein [Bacteroidales bacterium]